MAMDLRDPNVWISHLLENLPEEKLASALKDDNPNWEYIDGEIVKLGSLAHSQLDIPELQRRGLVILASESKDFRLLAHLLRTLQHMVILISHCACWRCMWSITGRWLRRRIWRIKNALPARSLNALKQVLKFFTERRHSAARCAVRGTGKTGAMLAVT